MHYHQEAIEDEIDIHIALMASYEESRRQDQAWIGIGFPSDQIYQMLFRGTFPEEGAFIDSNKRIVHVESK